MTRQVLETIKIRNTVKTCNLLNKKDTYNRCRLPGLILDKKTSTKH